MSTTSRPSANGTTEPPESEADGSPVRTHGIWRETDWPVSVKFSFRYDVRYWIWELIARLRHRVGVHTFVDIEVWAHEYGVDVITITGQECWLCPARRASEP